MPPEVVAFPASTEEVAAVARLCHEHRVALTPFGAGTSLEGHIQANFGVDVHVPSKDGPTDFVLIVGPPSNVARAKEYVLKLMVKADERSSRGQTEEY